MLKSTKIIYHFINIYINYFSFPVVFPRMNPSFKGRKERTMEKYVYLLENVFVPARVMTSSSTYGCTDQHVKQPPFLWAEILFA